MVSGAECVKAECDRKRSLDIRGMVLKEEGVLEEK